MKGSRLEHPGAARVGRLPGDRQTVAGALHVEHGAKPSLRATFDDLPGTACVVMSRARARGTEGRLHELHQEPHHSRRGRALAGQGIFLPCPGELGATRGAAHGPGAVWGPPHCGPVTRKSEAPSLRLPETAPGLLDHDRLGRLASPLGLGSAVRQTSTLCITGSGRGFRASPPGTQGDHATGPAPRRARRRGRAHPAEALL